MLEEPFRKTQDLVNHIKEYINTRITLLKITVVEKVAGLLASMLAGLLAIFFFLFFLLFISIAGALAISDWLGNLYLGFVIIGAFYLLLGFVIWKTRKKLLAIPAMNIIINEVFDEKPEKGSSEKADSKNVTE